MADDHSTSALMLSRRRWLVGASAAAGATCFGLVSAAAAPPGPTGQPGCSQLIPKKSSQQEARHLARVETFRRCGTCRMFLAPDQCVVVEGPTSADSVCQLWAINDGRRIGCVPDQLIAL